MARSRWYRPLPGVAPDPSALAAFLERLPFDRLVLIPCSDVWVIAVATLEARLGARFLTSQAPRESLDILLDKGRLAETMAHLGLPHPRTVRLGFRDHLTTMWDRNLQDAFLKPCNSQAFGRRFGSKAWRFRTLSQAEAYLNAARRAGLEMLLQEYVPGPPTAHYFVNGFVDRNGRVCGRFVYRRLRMFPRDFGNSSLAVSVPVDAASGAVRTLDRLLVALDYRGIFAAEFKHDPRDGVFKLLEVNARPWWKVGFAAECGVDVCEMAYRDALGLAVTPVTAYRLGRRWVYPQYDGKACAELFREGGLTPWAWFSSWIGASGPILAWDDPAPSAVGIIGRFRRIFNRRPSP